MIWIFNLERASAGVCDNYTDVYHYIRGLEDQQNLEDAQNANHVSKILSSSCQTEQKQWCIDFCKNHNYVIIETPSSPVNSEHPSWNSHAHSPLMEERFKQAS